MFTPPPEGVPFDYQHALTGLFHRWLGENSLHGKQSYYSLGWLKGDSYVRNGKLFFREKVSWDLGLPTEELADRFMNGISKHRFHLYGMKFLSRETLPTPDFSAGICRFTPNSPVLLRKSIGKGRRRHVIYTDPISDDLLTASALRRAEQFGVVADGTVRMRFVRNDPKAATRLVTIRSVKWRASACAIDAEATAELLQTLWVTGIGELTGSGFGALDYRE